MEIEEEGQEHNHHHHITLIDLVTDLPGEGFFERHILPLLGNRKDFNSLSLVNPIIHNHFRQNISIPPWPKNVMVNTPDGVEVSCMAFSQDGGKWLACGCRDGTIRLLNAQTGFIKKIIPVPVQQVVFSSETPSKLLLRYPSGSVWEIEDVNVDTPRPTRELFNSVRDPWVSSFPARACTIAPGGAHVAVVDASWTLCVYSQWNGLESLLCSFKLPDGLNEAQVAFSHCERGRYVSAYLCYENLEEVSVYIWDLQSRLHKHVTKRFGHSSLQHRGVLMPWSPVVMHSSIYDNMDANGGVSLVAEGSFEPDTPQGEAIVFDNYRQDHIACFAWSPGNGQVLATGRGGGTITLWNSSDGTCIKVLHNVYYQNCSVNSIAPSNIVFTPNGQVVVSPSARGGGGGGGGPGCLCFAAVPCVEE